MKGTSRVRILNGNIRRQWEMTKKFRDHERLITIMDHVASNLMWKIYSTLSFNTYLNVLQWIGFFKRLSDHSNKHLRRIMEPRNPTLYLGHKWTNITVGEIIRLFGIMLRISIETWEMGGYLSNFVEDPIIHLGCGYGVQLWGYDA